jgi:hypothetical protein
MRRRHWLQLSSLLAIACGGGGEGLAPDQPFPDVTGVYQLAGGFDGLSHSQASFTGSLTLAQASTQSGALTGSASLTLSIDGDVSTIADVQLQSAAVTPGGVISFRLGSTAAGGGWTFSGTRSAGVITGRHTLTDQESTFSGGWTGSAGGTGPTTGTLVVSTSTSGSILDADGYVVLLDGGDGGPIGVNDTITIAELSPGGHTVGLGSTAANCAVQGENPRSLVITPGVTSSLSIAVLCTTPAPSSGTVRVVTTTTGSSPDADGYTVKLDGAEPGLSITATGSITISDVAEGSHSVVLSGVAENCTAADGLTRSVPVTAGATAETGYAISCADSRAAHIEALSGNNQTAAAGTTLSNPLVVVVTDAGGHPVSGITVTWTPAGGGSVSETTVQTGTDGHASATRLLGNNAGPQSTQASVAGLSGSPVTFTHMATIGAAHAVVLVSGNNQSGGPGQELEPLVLKVTDSVGNPVAGVSVKWAVASGGGTVVPESTTTNAQGRSSTRWNVGAPGLNTLIATVMAEGIVGNPVAFSATAVATTSFDIQVRFLKPLSASQRQAFTVAERHWQRVITGDVSDARLVADASTCGDGSPAVDELVDDVIILVTVEAIDGPGGTLASAGPCWIRDDSGLPILGAMKFDAADLKDIEADGTIDDVILHEMGHVLGVGSLWKYQGLLADPSVPPSNGTDPHFTGPRAIAAFDHVGGRSYIGGKVPVENTGDPGTADGHWRESVMDNELMTGYIAGTPNPLSIVTIESLADQGYSVSTAAADPYSLTTALRAARRGPLRFVGDDRLRVPIRTVNAEGRVSRVLSR